MRKTSQENKPTNKELAALQIVLKSMGSITGYTGNVDGSPDPSINQAIAKAIDFVKSKLPDDSRAQSISISAADDGNISGSVSELALLLKKANNTDMYKVFEKSPFAGGRITNEDELKTAIAKTRAGIESSFSGTSIDTSKLLSEFDSAVSSKQIQTLEAAFSQLANFKKSDVGSGTKVAYFLAEKNANKILKLS